MYKKTIITIFSIFIFVSAFAQNTRSPYSIFGPGELQNKGFGKNLGMGGTGIGMPSNNFINNINPASYSGLDSLRFIYEVGFEGKYSKFKSRGEKLNDYTFNFKYISFGFRVTNWLATSFSIAPFSNVGYTITTKDYTQGTSDMFYSQYDGSGGINHLSWGNAIKLGNLSLGVHSSYLFGSIIQEEHISQIDEIFTPFIMKRTDYLKSFYFDYGIQYSFKLKEWDYTLGAIYNNQQKLLSRHQVDVMTADYTPVSTEEYKSKSLRVPEKYGFGFSARKKNIIHIAGDYELQKWSGIRYPIQRSSFIDSHRFAIGAESKPWGDIVTLDWYKKITYRIGANYKTSFLKLNGTQISEKALTFGLGIPIKNIGTLLNFTCEVGQKGTVSNGLIRENYVLFHMNFSINEVWFKQRIFY